MFTKRIGRLSMDKAIQTTTSFTQAIAKAQHAAPPKPQLKSLAAGNGSPAPVQYQNNIPSTSFNPQPALSLDKFAVPNLELNDDDQNTSLPPWYQGEGVSTDIYEGTPEDAYTPTVTLVNDTSDSDIPDADELIDDIEEANSLDLVAEEHEGLEDRDDLIDHLEGEGYEIETQDDDTSHTLEITDSETDETLLKIDERELPSGVVIEETTNADGETTTVVIDEDGNRTTLDEGQGTDREDIDDIAEDVSDGKDIDAIAEDLDLTPDQVIAQLKATGFVIISQDIYDEDGNNIGWYQKIVSQDDNEVIAVYRRSSEAPKESNDNLNLNQIDGTYETSYFIDSQGRVVELETFSPNGPVAEGHVSIETVTDENGRTTTTTRDENGETVAVTDNGYTLVTSPDGTITLHDAESDIELDIEPGGHEEALASELLELDLETEEGIIAAAEIMLLLDNDNKEGGSAVGELKDELDARNNELDEAIAEHGAGSPEAARARAAINTAYAAWLEAVAISNYRHLLLQEAALDPSATEARNNANARIDELLASYGQYVSRPSPQYTLEEVQELLEQAELEVELASEAKAEYEQAERLTVVATKEQETIYLPHHTVLIDPEGDYSLTDHAIDRSEGLAAQARVDELFSEANLHNTRGNKALADFEVSRLEQQRENAVPGTDDHSELSDALDAARTQQELASTQLEIAQSQYNLSLLNRLAYDEAEVLAEEYIEEFVTEEGYFDKHDKSHEDFRFFGTHSGEYTGYTLDERDNGELWINIHYENKTRNVQLTPASGDMTPWWRENRNSELISQWHETFENRENAQRGVYEATIPLYEALETQADDRIAELESKLTEQQELFGPPSIEAPENATPEHELVGLEGLPLQVPPQIAEQYAARGLDALLESGLPVRIMTDTINQSNQGWIQSSDNWQWVQPEMAHTMLELQELNIEKQNLKSAIEIQNGLSVLPLQLLGESNAEYEARAAYDSLDDTHREQTLDTIYQPRFQELLGQQQFNQDFEQLEGAALEARVLNTLGGEINNKQLREIMDEIHDIGGESPEIAGIPVFYVDQSGNQLQTALLAVRDKDDNVLYVDVTGRHYDDVEDFQNNNRQFQESGRLVIPQGFDTTPNEGGDIPLDVIDARNPSELETVVDPLVGFSSTAATVASFTPAAPVAAPLAFAGMLYMGIRQGFNQKDHIQHGGDWGDRESVMNSLGVVTSALPVGSSVMRTIGMVRVSGLSVGPAMDASIGALKPGTDLALNAQRYMMHSGRLNRFSRIADGAGMVGGMPLMGDTLGNLYLLGDQMSDSQKGQALLDLATGVVGTGLGARGLWTTRPNQDGAEDYNGSTTHEQTDPLVPDRSMIFKHEPETAQQLPSSPEPIRLYFNPITQQYGVKPKEIASDISTEVNDPSTEGRIASPGEGSSQDSLPIGSRNDTNHSHTEGDVSRDQNPLRDRLSKIKKAVIPTNDDRGSANLFGWLGWFKNRTNSASYNENKAETREEGSAPVHSPEMDDPNNSVLLPSIEWNSTIDQIIIPEGYKVVYRGDSRSPHEIQEAGGFRRQGRESSSRVIDTTLHLTAARYYANHNIKFYGGEGWVYAIIDKDVDSSPLFTAAPLPYDPAMDVPFKRDIPLESILAAQRVDEQKHLVAPVYLFTTSSQQSHPSFWLNDSAGKSVNASILGAPPKSVEAIYTPPEIGPHSHGDELGVHNKTHILVNEPDTGDSFIIPWVRGGSGQPATDPSKDPFPDLAARVDPIFHNKLIEHVRSEGGITFADFMDHSLYGLDGKGGYYNSGTVRIGDISSSDFITAPEKSKHFGYTVSRSLADMYESMGRPAHFDIVEMGAGNGVLARDIIEKLRRDYPELYGALRYTIVERSKALIERQQKTLGEQQRVNWLHASADAIPLRNIRGVFLSNELVDAFPVHRAIVRGDEIQEVYINVDKQGRFVEEVREPSQDLASVIPDLTSQYPLDSLRDGEKLTVNASSVHWIKGISAALDEGYVITIDYGQPAATQQAPYTYYKKQWFIDLAYDYPGAIDITAHADNLFLSQIGESFGLRTAYSLGAGLFDSQHDFLARHGGKEAIASEADPQEKNNALGLLSPAYDGFFVLVQQKNPTPRSLSATYHPEGAPYPERPSPLPAAFRKPQQLEFPESNSSSLWRLPDNFIGTLSRYPTSSVHKAKSAIDPAMLQSRLAEIGVSQGTAQAFVAEFKDSVSPTTIHQADTTPVPVAEPMVNFASEDVPSYRPMQLKLISETQVPSIALEHLVRVDPGRLTYFTPEQFTAFTKGQLAALTNKQVSKITLLQLKALSPEQIAAFTPEQLASFRSKQIAALRAEQIKELTTEQTGALTPNQVKAFSPEQWQAFKSTQLKSLDSELLQMAPQNILMRENLLSFSHQAINARLAMPAIEAQSRLTDRAIETQSHLTDRAIETQSRMADRAVEAQNRLTEHSEALTTEQSPSSAKPPLQALGGQTQLDALAKPRVTFDKDGPLLHLYQVRNVTSLTHSNKAFYKNHSDINIPEVVSIDREILETSLGPDALSGLPEDTPVRVSLSYSHRPQPESEPTSKGELVRKATKISPNMAATTALLGSAGLLSFSVGNGYIRSVTDSVPPFSDMAGSIRGFTMTSKAVHDHKSEGMNTDLANNSVNQASLNWDLNRIINGKKALELSNNSILEILSAGENSWAAIQIINSLPVTEQSEIRGWTQERKNQSISEAISNYQRTISKIAGKEALTLDPFDPRTAKGKTYLSIILPTHLINVGVSTSALINGRLTDITGSLPLHFVSEGVVVGFLVANAALASSAAIKLGAGVLANTNPSILKETDSTRWNKNLPSLNQITSLGTATGSFLYGAFTLPWVALTLDGATTAYSTGNYGMAAMNTVAVPFQTLLGYYGIAGMPHDINAFQSTLSKPRNKGSLPSTLFNTMLIPSAAFTATEAGNQLSQGNVLAGTMLLGGSSVQLYFSAFGTRMLDSNLIQPGSDSRPDLFRRLAFSMTAPLPALTGSEAFNQYAQGNHMLGTAYLASTAAQIGLFDRINKKSHQEIIDVREVFNPVSRLRIGGGMGITLGLGMGIPTLGQLLFSNDENEEESKSDTATATNSPDTQSEPTQKESQAPEQQNESPESSKTPLLVTAPSGLNLRSKPTTEALIVTVFPHGTVLEGAGPQETDTNDISWTYVTGQDLDGNKQDGWVATRYIEIEEEQPA